MNAVSGIEIFSLSDKGRVRSENQDKLLVDPENALFILADGAGGGRGGATASRITVDTMAMALKSLRKRSGYGGLWQHRERIQRLRASLYDAAQTANRTVVEQAAATTELNGMGSTLVAGVIDSRHCIAITAGDSRIYHFRAGQLQQVSDDHTLARQLIDQGFLQDGDDSASKYKNVLTRAIGMQERLEVSNYDFPVAKGDMILICSDGLTNMVSDDFISRVLSTQDPPMRKVQRLIQSANAAGGLDNISVILITYDGYPAVISRLLGRYWGSR